MKGCSFCGLQKEPAAQRAGVAVSEAGSVNRAGRGAPVTRHHYEKNFSRGLYYQRKLFKGHMEVLKGCLKVFNSHLM